MGAVQAKEPAANPTPARPGHPPYQKAEQEYGGGTSRHSSYSSWNSYYSLRALFLNKTDRTPLLPTTEPEIEKPSRLEAHLYILYCTSDPIQRNKQDGALEQHRISLNMAALAVIEPQREEKQNSLGEEERRKGVNLREVCRSAVFGVNLRCVVRAQGCRSRGGAGLI